MHNKRTTRILEYWRLRGRLEKILKWCKDMHRPPAPKKPTVMQYTGLEDVATRTLAEVKAGWKEIFDGNMTVTLRFAMTEFGNTSQRHAVLLEAELDSDFHALLAATLAAWQNLRSFCGEAGFIDSEPAKWRKPASWDERSLSDNGRRAHEPKNASSVSVRDLELAEDTGSNSATASDSQGTAISIAESTVRAVSCGSQSGSPNSGSDGKSGGGDV